MRCGGSGGGASRRPRLAQRLHLRHVCHQGARHSASWPARQSARQLTAAGRCSAVAASAAAPTAPATAIATLLCFWGRASARLIAADSLSGSSTPAEQRRRLGVVCPPWACSPLLATSNSPRAPGLPLPACPQVEDLAGGRKGGMLSERTLGLAVALATRPSDVPILW